MRASTTNDAAALSVHCTEFYSPPYGRIERVRVEVDVSVLLLIIHERFVSSSTRNSVSFEGYNLVELNVETQKFGKKSMMSKQRLRTLRSASPQSRQSGRSW